MFVFDESHISCCSVHMYFLRYSYYSRIQYSLSQHSIVTTKRIAVQLSQKDIHLASEGAISRWTMTLSREEIIQKDSRLGPVRRPSYAPLKLMPSYHIA